MDCDGHDSLQIFPQSKLITYQHVEPLNENPMNYKNFFLFIDSIFYLFLIRLVTIKKKSPSNLSNNHCISQRQKIILKIILKIIKIAFGTNQSVSKKIFEKKFKGFYMQ